MSNRQVEAVLRLSAKLGNLQAINTLQKKLNEVERASNNFNRAQRARAQVTNAALAAGARYLAPAALAYGAKGAIIQFAGVERQLTRTGLVLGVTRKDMADLRGDIERTAKAYALSNDAVMQTVDAYAAAGAEYKDIRTDIDTLAKAQQALDASGADTVQSWDAARKTFQLASKDAEKFFEIIGAGSAAGKVEAKDLAQMMPSLLPVAARYGMSGLDDTSRLVAALEAMADYTGSPSEAATSMNDFLEKISAPDVVKNFSKFGIDLPKRLKDAQKEGKDLFRVMHELMMQATKGDPTKLGYLFGDKEARRFADMVLNRLDAIEVAQNKIKANAPNLLNRNTAEVLADTQAKLDRLSSSWDDFYNKAGAGLSTVASPALEQVNTDIDKATTLNSELTKSGMSQTEQFWWRLQHVGIPRMLGDDSEDEMLNRAKQRPAYLEYQAVRTAGQPDPDLPALPAGAKQTKQTMPGNGGPLPTVRPDPNAPEPPKPVYDAEFLQALQRSDREAFIRSEKGKAPTMMEAYGFPPLDPDPETTKRNSAIAAETASRDLLAMAWDDLSKVLFGAAAEKDFNLRDHIRQGFRDDPAIMQSAPAVPNQPRILEDRETRHRPGLASGADIVDGMDARLRDAMTEGGENASQSVTSSAEDIRQAGRDAGDAIRQGATDAASRLRAELSNLTINARVTNPAGGAGLASGNPGRTMVGAGTLNSGAERRTPGGQP